MFLSRMSDHRIEAGMASLNTPFARLITSDSVVDLLVEVCSVLDHVRGKYVLGPVSTTKFPDVDLVSSLSPAGRHQRRGTALGPPRGPQFSLLTRSWQLC